MSEERPWDADAKGLAKGSENPEEIIALIDAAGDHAKKGDFNAAAESLESVRAKLVAGKHFEKYDNDIWVFTDIISAVRRQAPEGATPTMAFLRFLNAAPRAVFDQDMSRSEKKFWYGSPDVQVGGEIRLVPTAAATPDEAASSKCFVATAAYGSALAPEVAALRSFRDGVLLRRRLGRAFVRLYYAASPPLARWIESRPVARSAARTFFLAPLLILLRRAGLIPETRR